MRVAHSRQINARRDKQLSEGALRCCETNAHREEHLSDKTEDVLFAQSPRCKSLNQAVMALFTATSPARYFCRGPKEK